LRREVTVTLPAWAGNGGVGAPSAVFWLLKLTTSVLTATTLKYTIGAGITAGAGTRLFLQLLLGLSSNQPTLQTVLLVPFSAWEKVVISRHYLAVLALGNFRACCRP
jgi:hypothetical protein